jgi:hypothetical protein
VLHAHEKTWWFVGGSSQRSTPIGQHFSLNTQKSINSSRKFVLPIRAIMRVSYIFRDSFHQRTNNINNYFPDRLYRQDPATMLGGLFAFAKSVLVHFKKKTSAIGPKIEKKLLKDCPRRDHTTVQRV